ncbi:MAG TPA: secretin N-terminal domain-containing protein, partial [Pirellulales bacterium]|nr:secretin N-terminal domain-containing protein [Pirellulales bacterium]
PSGEIPAPAERGDHPPTDDRPLPPEARAPVKITVEPDGIVISSSDIDALDRLEDLMARLMPTRMTYKVFELQHIDSLDMVLLLRDFFREQGASSARAALDSDTATSRSSVPSRATLGKRKALSFVSDSRTNTILVQGADAAQLEEIESLIEFYDIPEPPNSESVRRTKRVALRYAKAKDMADVVKDVYRDLLSPNDRALLAGMPQQQRQQGGDGFASSSSSYPLADTSRSGLVPRFKGLLSVGVDERTNGLVLSAPQGVLNEIVGMVKELDAAARSTRQVITLLRVKGAGTAAFVQQAVAPKKEQTAGGQQPGTPGAASGAQPTPGQGGGNVQGGQQGGMQLQVQDAASAGGNGNGQGGFGGGQRGQGGGRQRGTRGQ